VRKDKTLTTEPAQLRLEDGKTFSGTRFGADIATSGEVVFTTAMVGYPESLTDPSYFGQILVFTYPLIGNYAVPDPHAKDQGIKKFLESERIQVKGVIVSEYCQDASHHRQWITLNEWLKENAIAALYNVDTRSLTQHLRDHGVMLGQIARNHTDSLFDPNQENSVGHVSRKEATRLGRGNLCIAVLDCGIKNNIIRELLSYDTKLIIYPFNADVTTAPYDGLLISNGPGNPAKCVETIATIRNAMELGKPILGICLGHQLLALAAGAKTYKLKFGHRSHNQPCAQKNGRAFVTAQNHGYAVDASSLPENWLESFYNTNDGTNEGIRHRHLPFSSVQFHPEGASGPMDSRFLFAEFIETVKTMKR
jgi:carbamoyl-phosphate synthase small subunit